jgi:phosphatidylglycerophosphate synthase
MSWKTKATDRFVLKYIKLYISAPVSLMLIRILPQIRPTALTFLAAALGISGGIAFGRGLGWQGGLLAALAQILDGVDGQIARLTGRVSSEGALLDSVLDRYMDFALLFGILFHCLRCSVGVRLGTFTFSPGWLIVIAGVAAAGCSQVSYVTARAASLKLAFSRPEYAGKGSRTSVIVICGLLTPLWIHFPLVALCYLAIHPNLAVIVAMIRSRFGQSNAGRQA